MGTIIGGGPDETYFLRDGKLYREFARTNDRMAWYREATPAERDGGVWGEVSILLDTS